MAMLNYAIYSQVQFLHFEMALKPHFSEIKTQVVQWRFIATQYVGIDCAEITLLAAAFFMYLSSFDSKNACSGIEKFIIYSMQA